MMLNLIVSFNTRMSDLVRAPRRRDDVDLRVRQLVEPLLDHHPDQAVGHKLEDGAGRRAVADLGLELVDLVGALQDLERNKVLYSLNFESFSTTS